MLPNSTAQASGLTATLTATFTAIHTATFTVTTTAVPTTSLSSVNTASTSPVNPHVSPTPPVQPSSTSSPPSSSGMCSQISFTIAKFAVIPWGIHMHSTVFGSKEGSRFHLRPFLCHISPTVAPPPPPPTPIISICSSATCTVSPGKQFSTSTESCTFRNFSHLLALSSPY